MFLPNGHELPMFPNDLLPVPFPCVQGSVTVSGPRQGSSSSNISNGEVRETSSVMLVGFRKDL